MADPALPGLASWAEEYCGGVLVGAALNCPVRGVDCAIQRRVERGVVWRLTLRRRRGQLGVP